MFKVTILVNNKRDTVMASGDQTPRTILSGFGGGDGLKFNLSGTSLNAEAMDTPIGVLAERYHLPENLFLSGVVKTDNA